MKIKQTNNGSSYARISSILPVVCRIISIPSVLATVPVDIWPVIPNGHIRCRIGRKITRNGLKRASPRMRLNFRPSSTVGDYMVTRALLINSKNFSILSYKNPTSVFLRSLQRMRCNMNRRSHFSRQ